MGSIRARMAGALHSLALLGDSIYSSYKHRLGVCGLILFIIWGKFSVIIS